MRIRLVDNGKIVLVLSFLTIFPSLAAGQTTKSGVRVRFSSDQEGVKPLIQSSLRPVQEQTKGAIHKRISSSDPKIQDLGTKTTRLTDEKILEPLQKPMSNTVQASKETMAKPGTYELSPGFSKPSFGNVLPAIKQPEMPKAKVLPKTPQPAQIIEVFEPPIFGIDFENSASPKPNGNAPTENAPTEKASPKTTSTAAPTAAEVKKIEPIKKAAQPATQKTKTKTETEPVRFSDVPKAKRVEEPKLLSIQPSTERPAKGPSITLTKEQLTQKTSKTNKTASAPIVIVESKTQPAPAIVPSKSSSTQLSDQATASVRALNNAPKKETRKLKRLVIKEKTAPVRMSMNDSSKLPFAVGNPSQDDTPVSPSDRQEKDVAPIVELQPSAPTVSNTEKMQSIPPINTGVRSVQLGKFHRFTKRKNDDSTDSPVEAREKQQLLNNSTANIARVTYDQGSVQLSPMRYSLTQDGGMQHWSCRNFLWQSTGFYHRPLYFEQKNLERYGNDYGILTNTLSAAHFVGNIAMLPYNVGAYPTDEPIYTLGHSRPGDCVPQHHYSAPRSLRGTMFQAVSILGGAFILP